MDKNTENYLKMRPYSRGGPPALLTLMGRQTAEGFSSPWQRFGYEIGGPLCFAFTKWIADEIEQKHPDVTDVAFIARDGYLLRQIWAMLPHAREIPAHYVYAPRSVKKQCQDPAEHEKYRAYLRGMGFGGGTIATVDTVTMEFSGQRLIASSVAQPVHGFCWVALGEDKKLREGLRFSTYQRQHYHVIANWNIMEFIMTSPEPPVQSLAAGRPVYAPPDAFEAKREAIFAEVSAGVLAFARDACRLGAPSFTVEEMVGWINGYLRHPTAEDRTLFADVRFSETADHSDSILLEPFAPPALKDRLWFLTQRHPVLHQVLRRGKRLWKKARSVTGGDRTNGEMQG